MTLPLTAMKRMMRKLFVEICINNIVADYRVYLENIGISQFSRLLKVVRNTILSVKPSMGRSRKADKKKAHHALAVDDRSDNKPRKMKENENEREHILH